MSNATDARALIDSPTNTALPDALSFDERWAEWREKGDRQDARSGRHMRWLALLVVLTIGMISALAWLR